MSARIGNADKKNSIDSNNATESSRLEYFVAFSTCLSKNLIADKQNNKMAYM